MALSALVARMKKELQMLQDDPPHGIAAWPVEERTNLLRATIQGPDGTPYENGVFKLEISIPDRYPFEPPKVRFITPIYHPNIDNGGRICLDILVMPPKGAWKPSLNVSTVLTSIQSLIAEPNPDDGLMADITNEFKHNKMKFVQTAKNWTKQYAMEHLSKLPEEDNNSTTVASSKSPDKESPDSKKKEKTQKTTTSKLNFHDSDDILISDEEEKSSSQQSSKSKKNKKASQSSQELEDEDEPLIQTKKKKRRSLDDDKENRSSQSKKRSSQQSQDSNSDEESVASSKDSKTSLKKLPTAKKKKSL